MQLRPFGIHDLPVSALGFGAGHIGDPSLSEREVEALLHAALDAGVNLFDTARGYGLSEERLGRYLSSRRSRVVLSTKCGYGIEGLPDWTGPTILAGVDAALSRLRTDWIDILHLHSCPIEVLRREDIAEALRQIVASGKVRITAYSGEGEALHYALCSGLFGGVQASLNVCDQRVIQEGLRLARDKGMGFIAKRPLANAPWRFLTRPTGHYAEVYWERFQTMRLPTPALGWSDLALRFCASLPGVSSCIVGTRSQEHLQRACQSMERGPLSTEEVALLRERFQQNDQGWSGQL